MNISLDSLTVSITCPQCGQQLKEKLGRLKREQHISCTSCGRFPVDTDQITKMETTLNKDLAKLGRQTVRIKL